MVSRSQKNPQDKQVLKQIDDVKNYLISFSDQQRVVLDKVRSFLRNLEEERKKSIFVESQELGPPALPIKQEQKTSRCSTPVKNSKNRPKKKGKGKSKNSSSTSPDSSDEENYEVFLAYFESSAGYRGHVEDYDVECPPNEENSELAEDQSDEEVTFFKNTRNFRSC